MYALLVNVGPDGMFIRDSPPPQKKKKNQNYMRGCERSSVFGPFTVVLNVGPDEMFIRGPPPSPLNTVQEGMDHP